MYHGLPFNMQVTAIKFMSFGMLVSQFTSMKIRYHKQTNNGAFFFDISRHFIRFYLEFSAF